MISTIVLDNNGQAVIDVLHSERRAYEGKWLLKVSIDACTFPFFSRQTFEGVACQTKTVSIYDGYKPVKVDFRFHNGTPVYILNVPAGEMYNGIWQLVFLDYDLISSIDRDLGIQTSRLVIARIK